MIWKGERPVSERVILARRTVSVNGLSLNLLTEDIRAPTDWCFHEECHTLVIHLEGQFQSMECEFSRGPSGHVLPAVGDIWMIPAGCRYAALAQGSFVRFAELVVPTGLLAEAELPARMCHRDPFLMQAVLRTASLAEREDELARMLLHTVVEGLKLHLLDLYGPGRSAPKRTRLRALSPLEEARLREAIHGDLSRPQSLEGLAHLVGRTVHELLPAFRDAFGLTPWQYIIHARLEAARRRLAEADTRITEIALDLGFSSSSHFATTFHKHFGVTPTAFRRALR